MNTGSRENANEETMVQYGKGTPIAAHGTLSEAVGIVTPADAIVFEDSPNLRYLRLKNGDFSLPHRVFLVLEGKKFEITMQALPNEQSD